jgi:hypothetical protein
MGGKASNTNLMQRVSECELVVFCGEAAASPQGWPPQKPLSPFRRFLIANGIRLECNLRDCRAKGGLSGKKALGLP